MTGKTAYTERNMFKAVVNTKQCPFLSSVLQQLLAPVRWPCAMPQQDLWFPRSAQCCQTQTSKEGASLVQLQSTHMTHCQGFRTCSSIAICDATAASRLRRTGKKKSAGQSKHKGAVEHACGHREDFKASFVFAQRLHEQR